MAFKFESCLSCQVCFYNREKQSSICSVCDGENMLIPISEDEISEMDLALKNENTKLRYYMDLCPTLKNSIDNCELTIDN